MKRTKAKFLSRINQFYIHFYILWWRPYIISLEIEQLKFNDRYSVALGKYTHQFSTDQSCSEINNVNVCIQPIITAIILMFTSPWMNGAYVSGKSILIHFSNLFEIKCTLYINTVPFTPVCLLKTNLVNENRRPSGSSGEVSVPLGMKDFISFSSVNFHLNLSHHVADSSLVIG